MVNQSGLLMPISRVLTAACVQTVGETWSPSLCSFVRVQLRIVMSPAGDFCEQDLYEQSSPFCPCGMQRANSRSRSLVFQLPVCVQYSTRKYGGPWVHSDVASAAGPHLLRILSALCPHYSRSLSAPFPQPLRSVTVFPHCFRCISAVLYTALFPRYLRTVAAVLPRSVHAGHDQFKWEDCGQDSERPNIDVFS